MGDRNPDLFQNQLMEKIHECGGGGSEGEAAAQEGPGSGGFWKMQKCIRSAVTSAPCSVPLLSILTRGMCCLAFAFCGKNQAGRGRNNKKEWRDKAPVEGWKEERLPSIP